MAASLETIKSHFSLGLANGATHMVMVCDTFDYEDYPVYVEDGQSVQEVVDQYNSASMQRVMEVYKLSLGWEAQSTGRVMNL